MTAYPPIPRRVLVVAVCHQLQPDAFIATLQGIASRDRFLLQGVVVSNNTAHVWPSMPRQFEVLRGSNQLLDFSGFFEGLDWLIANHPETAQSNVLFINDSLVTKHAASCNLRRVLSLDAVMRQLQVPAMAGKLQPYRLVCLRNPWSGLPGYIPTFCFSLNGKALPILRRLLSQAASDDVLVAAQLTDDAWGRRMPRVFREYIRAHLAYAGSPYLWPSSAAPNANLLQKKACCVYFESRLSGDVGSEGAIVPINSGLRSSTHIFVREFFARMVRSLKFG